ncbi:unnamed protein product [Urochloa humidicola]
MRQTVEHVLCVRSRIVGFTEMAMSESSLRSNTAAAAVRQPAVLATMLPQPRAARVSPQARKHQPARFKATTSTCSKRRRRAGGLRKHLQRQQRMRVRTHAGRVAVGVL